MITYKHEAFIAQAIEGVLMQETNFDYELIIADDCSPDNTEYIVRNIIETHPNGYRIKYFRHNENKGMQGNGIFALKQCTGKYIAICEGDDYWTDPFKLQKQVDFLEGNEGYALCFHNAEVLENNIIKHDYTPKSFRHSQISTKDLLNSHFIATASILYRRDAIDIYQVFDKRFASGDIWLMLNLRETGYFGYIDIKASVYRMHDGGISKTHIGNRKILDMIYLFSNFDIITQGKYRNDIEEAIIRHIGLFYTVPQKIHRKWFLALTWNEKLKLLLKTV